MKPNISRICTNPSCKEFEKDIELTEDECRFPSINSVCSTCQSEGKMRLVHKSIVADSSDAFYAKVGGMAKEFHLLKKLISKGISEPEDQTRFDEILEQIKDLECSGCGQKLIHHEH